jgi:hypothetical protein
MLGKYKSRDKNLRIDADVVDLGGKEQDSVVGEDAEKDLVASVVQGSIIGAVDLRGDNVGYLDGNVIERRTDGTGSDRPGISRGQGNYKMC